MRAKTKELELERRRKISETMKRKGLTFPNLKGHKWTKEQNKKRSEKLKGHEYHGDFFKAAQEHVKEYGHYLKDKHHPEEVKDKISKTKTIHGKSNYAKKALKKYGEICNKCGFNNEIALLVHHKDKNRMNNELENLEVLCWNCHMIEHNKFRGKRNG